MRTSTIKPQARRRRTALTTAVAGLVCISLAACATDSVRSNNFTKPLNDFQVTITTVAQAKPGKDLSTAITNAKPEIEQQFKAMEAAVPFLPDELKSVADTCIRLSKAVTVSVETIAQAEVDKSQKKLDAGIAELQTTLPAFDRDCVQAYNDATGVTVVKPEPAATQ